MPLTIDQRPTMPPPDSFPAHIYRKIKQICNLLPQDIRSGIVVGLGLLLTMIGLMHMNVVVPSPFSMVELGALTLPLCYGCAVLAAMMALGETSYKYEGLGGKKEGGKVLSTNISLPCI